jgi:tetratricopeptide (TPR) repeat protein
MVTNLAGQKGSRVKRPITAPRSTGESAGTASTGSRALDVLFALALLVATLIAYQPSWHGDMIWDDDGHMTREDLRSTDGLLRIWFQPGDTQQYYPLMHTAFWFQHKLWGDDTLGYHLVNTLLHVVVAILFMLVLRRLQIPGAYLAAAIFALHPVHVESVAWISELKNTLSGTFYLGAALAYLHFDEGRERKYYWLAFGLFVLALLSKAVTATLPAALLLIFWWRRGRLDWRGDVLPLVPFFVFGITVGLFIAFVERVLIGAEGSLHELGVIERGLVAGRVVWFYLGKLIWPANLMFNYPRWDIDPTVWWQYLFPASALALLAGLWLLRRRTRGPLTAFLYFGGTLFPVLGFFNVYPFMFSFVADHFQYLASLGIISLGAAGVALLAARWKHHVVASRLVIGLSVLLVGLLGTLTWRHSRLYANVEVLYRETLKRNPTSWLCSQNLGAILSKRGNNQEALQHFQNALRYNPEYADLHYSLGLVTLELGRLEESKQHFQNALRHEPGHIGSLSSLPDVMIRLGEYEQAISHCQEAIRKMPGNADVHQLCGYACEKQGKLDEAVDYYQRALELVPDAAGTEYHLGSVLALRGQLSDAVVHLERALELQPGFTKASNKLAEVRQALEASRGKKQ